jgi:hypothetical protein
MKTFIQKKLKGGLKMDKVEQKDKTKVLLGVLMALVVLSGVLSYYGVSKVGSVDLSGLSTKLEALDAKVNAVGSKVDVVDAKVDAKPTEAPVTPDAVKLNRVCELTDGCEFWEPNNSSVQLALLYNGSEFVGDASEDFLENFADLVEMDEDYLKFDSMTQKDYQVRTYTDEDKEDGNWEVKLFLKVKYHDEDDDDDVKTSYVLITSVLDEEEYKSLKVEKVERTFEFE